MILFAHDNNIARTQITRIDTSRFRIWLQGVQRLHLFPQPSRYSRLYQLGEENNYINRCVDI